MQQRGIHRILSGGLSSKAVRPRRERSSSGARRLLLAAVTAIAVIAPGEGRAQMQLAPSAGCAAANAGAFDSASGGAPVQRMFANIFTAGETLTFTALGGVVSADFTDNTAGVGPISIPGGGSRTYMIPADGSRSFTTNLEGDEGGATLTVRCTPASSSDMPDMGTMTTMDMLGAMERFVEVRIDRLLEDEPDRPRLLRKDPAALIGPEVSAPFALTSKKGTKTFKTSLGQWAAHAAKQAEKKAAAAGRRYGPALGVSPTVDHDYDSKVDVWAEVHVTALDDHNDEVERNAHALFAYVGADYLWRPNVLVGVLVQYDNMEEDADRLKAHADGHGFMAGPYVSMRLMPHLYFDGRVAWGRSDNDQLVDNAKGEYGTDRWLVKGELTGDWIWSRFRLQPRVMAKYIQERRETFVDSSGNVIGGRDVSIGRLTFGPQISRHFATARGLIVEPLVRLDGIWDFDKTDPMVGHLRSYLDDDLRAKVEAGVMVSRADRYNIRATASYDGLFSDDFEAVSGRLWINIPLN